METDPFLLDKLTGHLYHILGALQPSSAASKRSSNTVQLESSRKPLSVGNVLVATREYFDRLRFVLKETPLTRRTRRTPALVTYDLYKHGRCFGFLVLTAYNSGQKRGSCKILLTLILFNRATRTPSLHARAH